MYLVVKLNKIISIEKSLLYAYFAIFHQENVVIDKSLQNRIMSINGKNVLDPYNIGFFESDSIRNFIDSEKHNFPELSDYHIYESDKIL